MIFWDSSAVVPLLIREPHSDAARRLLEGDPEVLVWWGTPVECLSAIARRERDGGTSREALDSARANLFDLRNAWAEVTPSDALREHAETALLRHSIRAADALQLASALVWGQGRARGRRFLSLDDRLAEAARREGFELVRMD